MPLDRRNTSGKKKDDLPQTQTPLRVPRRVRGFTACKVRATGKSERFFVRRSVGQSVGQSVGRLISVRHTPPLPLTSRISLMPTPVFAEAWMASVQSNPIVAST